MVGGVGACHMITKLYDSLVWPVIAYGAAIWVIAHFLVLRRFKIEP